MKFTRIIAVIVLVSISISTFAQVAIDPTGKRFIKPRERTKYGGPTPLTHKIEKSPDNVNITFVEIQVDPSAKAAYEVSVRGTKTPKTRGCDNCTVAGRVIMTGNVAKEFTSATSDSSTNVKQLKNVASCRTVSFKTADNKEYAVVTNPEGGFMLSTLPNGTYTIWVGGKKVISEFILTYIEPTPEQLKKEQEMREMKKETEKKEETPADH
ncbi:MAG: hypothetical protein K9I70_11420 [Chitinophagaceae bacterium]|nr:hypothetical protein [Chitinophagaceae bacterium]